MCYKSVFKSWRPHASTLKSQQWHTTSTTPLHLHTSNQVTKTYTAQLTIRKQCSKKTVRLLFISPSTRGFQFTLQWRYSFSCRDLHWIKLRRALLCPVIYVTKFYYEWMRCGKADLERDYVHHDYHPPTKFVGHKTLYRTT